MTTEQVKAKTQKVVLGMLPDIDDQELADDSDIFSLGLDSINAMSLVFGLQDEFNILFEPSEISFENFRTVSDIVALISNKKER
jgi:acyl carrier protein